MLLNPALVTRTCRVLLPLMVCASDQVLWPTVLLAVTQLAPLSSDTSTVSPVTVLALRVPLMVCEAVWVIRSVVLVPVSAEKVALSTVVVGAVPRVMMPVDAALTLPAASTA